MCTRTAGSTVRDQENEIRSIVLTHLIPFRGEGIPQSGARNENRNSDSLGLLPVLVTFPAMAQAPQAPPAGRGAAQAPFEIDKTAPTEDFKPSSLNQPGKQYPEVNSQRRVRTQMRAPNAQSVQINIWAAALPIP